MNDNGQHRIAREGYLTTKHVMLHVASRLRPVIVESNLAPCNHFQVLGQFRELRVVLLARLSRVLRMNPDGSVNPVIVFRDGDRCVEFVGAGAAAADRENRLDAFGVRTREHFGAIGVEVFGFEVRV